MKTKSFWFGISLFSVLIGLVPQQLAQAVTMSPTRLELAADPGKGTSGVVKVYNDERVPRTLYLAAAKFESKDETGIPEFVPERDGIPSWITIQSSVDVPPLEAREVSFTVNVPVGTDPGGYFAAIFASVLPPTPGDGMVAVKSDVGTLLLFRVNGDFPEGETILEFATKDKKIFNHLPIEFYYRFQNSGADRAQPLGDITIRNWFGGLSKIVSANKGAGNVLPQSIRRFEAAWITSGGEDVETNYEKPVYPEFETFWAAVKYQAENFALGYYSAELNLTVNNDSSRNYNKHTSFWVLPWQLLLVVLAVLVVFVLPLVLLTGAIIVYFRRRRQANP